MRSVGLVASCLVALLAAPPDARACTCLVLYPFAWPSGLKDVPRNAHVLLVSGGTGGEFVLLDGGPAHSDDEVGRRLVAPEENPPRREDLGRITAPTNSVEVPLESRSYRSGGSWVAELVPLRPLPARHRFFVLAGSGASRATAPLRSSAGKVVAGVFETGDQLSGTHPGTPEIVLKSTWPPNPKADGAMCESSSGSARFAKISKGASKAPVGIWLEDSNEAQPDALALMEGRELELGRTFCTTFGMPLVSGKRRVTIREWAFNGFGPPVIVTFEIPKGPGT